MFDKLAGWFTPAHRRWLYDASTAVTAGLGVWGLVSDEKLGAVNLVLAAVLNVARRNVNDEG